MCVCVCVCVCVYVCVCVHASACVCACVHACDLLLSVCPPSDAQTLADIAVTVRKVDLSVSHTECAALSTVYSLPGVTELWVTVRSHVKASPCLFGIHMNSTHC